MASIKISQLTAANDIQPDDLITIVQSGVNKRISSASFFGSVRSDLEINPDNGAIELIVNSQSGNNLLKTYPTLHKVGVGLGVSTPESLLHVNGDLTVGNNTTDIPGHIVTSRKVTNLATTTNNETEIAVDITYRTTVLNAPQDTKIGNVVLTLSTPSKDGIFKTILYGKKDAAVVSPINYRLQTTNIAGTTGSSSIIFNYLGDSIQLYSYDSKWFIIGYNGIQINL
jgi:hypothetical protein